MAVHYKKHDIKVETAEKQSHGGNNPTKRTNKRSHVKGVSKSNLVSRQSDYNSMVLKPNVRGYTGFKKPGSNKK